MGALKQYVTTINGTETTLVLDEEEAKARGLSGGKAYKVAETPTASDPDPDPATKTRPAANKARAAENKSGAAAADESA